MGREKEEGIKRGKHLRTRSHVNREKERHTKRKTKNKKYEKIYAKNQPKVLTVTTTDKNPRTKTKQNQIPPPH